MNDWIIKDHSRNRDLHRDSRAEAEDVLDEFRGDLELELIDPDGNTIDKNYGDDSEQDVEPEVVDHTEDAKADGGSVETDDPTPEEMEADPDIITSVDDLEQGDGYDLPDKPNVDTNPIEWMPSHFIDEIQGVPTVNRMGYCILCEQYGVSVKAEPVTLPSETDFEYAEFRAVATTEDGQEYTGFGSAHVDRQDGDDPYLLAELAETRSLKRAAAWATGIGMTAASEMTSDLQ